MRSRLNALLPGVLCACSLLPGCRESLDPHEIPVVVDPSHLAGVEIIAPGDARFDREARQIVGAKLDLVKTLSPFLLLIKNGSQHTIVAYSVEWDLRRGGDEIPHISQRMYPMAVPGPQLECDEPRGRDIRPGEEWLVADDIEFGSRIDDASGADVDFSETAKVQPSELSGVSAVRVHLDAVIFDDGTLAGPDREDLPGKFVPFVEDHQSLYRSILASLRAGESAEKLHDSLEQKRRQEFEASTKEITPPGREHDSMMEKLIAEQDVLGAWRNHGNSDSLAHFSRCLKTPPFVVSRKN